MGDAAIECCQLAKNAEEQGLAQVDITDPQVMFQKC